MSNMNNPAMRGWTNQDDRSLNDLLGFDDNGMPIEPQNGPDTQMRVVGMDLHFPDDLSTIAGDTLAESYPHDVGNPRTPEKDGNIKFVGTDDDEETQPETPPKYSKDSLASKSFSEGHEPRRFSRCQLLLIAMVLGSILLGAIAVMSVTLHQMRNDDSSSSVDDDSTASSLETSTGKDLPFFDVVDEGDSSPTSAPVMSPLIPTTDRPMSDSIKETILSTVPNFYAASDAVLSDPTSIQYQVLGWMAQDPLISSYSSERIVQRFALGVVYWSLTAPAMESVTGGWMTYTNECQWPTSRDSGGLCGASDTVTAIYLEDMGFSGTLAPEIGLLTNLELVFLTSNNINGELPTQLGLLTSLARLNLPRNAIEGTLPTEIGLLENLGILGLGNNKLGGPLPSEFGNMERLGSLLLQNNALNGTLPDEISSLSRLVKLQLEFNNFEGLLPEGLLLNLTLLEELTLQGNDFSGEIPAEVCTVQALQLAAVDCDKVVCSCCDGCDSFTDLPNDIGTEIPTTSTSSPSTSTESPTSNISPGTSTELPTTSTISPDTSTELPTSTTSPDTITSTELPTSTVSPTTTDTGTLAPSECQVIQPVNDCYEVGAFIDFETFNCEPSESDVLGFYRLKDLLKSGFRDAIFWMPASCVETECSFVMKDGFLFNEESGSADALDSSTSWPFAADEYVLFLFRLDESASLEFMAESFPFTVAEGCPLTMDP